MDFNCDIMLLSIAWNMQSALVKFDQELKIGNNFACSHIVGTGDTVEQVAAVDQQTTVLLWSPACAEFD